MCFFKEVIISGATGFALGYAGSKIAKSSLNKKATIKAKLENVKNFFNDEQGTVDFSKSFKNSNNVKPESIPVKDMVNKGKNDLESPNQVHHFVSNKSSKYTSQFENITKKYNLNLDDAWNKELMPHQGRHPNAYHDWILEELQTIDKVAGGNKEAFLQMFEDVKTTVKDNPDMLRKIFWE